MKKELLMKKYQSGDLGPDDRQMLESYIEQGIIGLDELQDLDDLHGTVNVVPESIPSEQMKERFYSFLADKKRRVSNLNFWDRFWEILSMDVRSGQIYRLAYTMALLVIGLTAGWLLSPVNKYQEQISDINSEVHEMKEIMMLSMLDKPSVTERLKAVNLSSEIPATYGRVIDALLNTLNTDDNVNVRLAALEVLAGYANVPEVRKNLIKSIPNQDSPLVQLELANLMVAIQAKGSVEEFKKIIEKENTDPEIKKKLEESIVQLI